MRLSSFWRPENGVSEMAFPCTPADEDVQVFNFSWGRSTVCRPFHVCLEWLFTKLKIHSSALMKSLSDVLFLHGRQQRWIPKILREFAFQAPLCSVQIEVTWFGHYFEEERNSINANKASQRSMNYFVDKLANLITVKTEMMNDCTPGNYRNSQSNARTALDWSSSDSKVEIGVVHKLPSISRKQKCFHPVRASKLNNRRKKARYKL